jgi:hypothetical protein
MTAPLLARCTTRGCPVRYGSGPDRPCLLHHEDRPPTLTERMAIIGAILEQPPGDHETTD